jgi:hypothetical protein
MSIRALQALDKVARRNVPNADALVQRSRCHKLGVGRDCYSSYTVLDGKSQRVSSCFNVPESDSSVTTAGGDGSAVSCEVERVDVLLVTREVVANDTVLDVPDL